MGFWNVNGLRYTDNNNLHYLFKQSLIQNSNLANLALSETFVCGDQHLSIPDFTWIGHKATMVFSLFWMSVRIRFRPRITKKKTDVFFCPARIELLPIFEKKHLILVNKKTVRKKTR